MSHDDRLYRELCESAHDLIQSASADGRLEFVNRAWLTTLGHDAGEVAGMHVLDVVRAEHRERFAAALEQLRQGRSAVELELEFVARSGAAVQVEGTLTTRREDATFLGTGGIFRDVSERRRAEEELTRLFELSPDLLCIAGTDGYFKRINPAFEKVLGYEPSELLRHSAFEFIHPEDRQPSLEEVERLATGRPSVEFRNRFRAHDGSWRWIAWRATPVPRSGLIYATGRDITQQQRMQDLLARRSEELARSNADLEQFASVASHDLRAPLRGIGRLAGWIEQDMPEQLPPRVRRHLERLTDQAQRMQRIVDDLLDFARSDRRSAEATTVDLGALVREITGLLDGPAGIEVRPAPDLPVISTVRGPLEQVLRNLIANAVQHHDRAHGLVEVAARSLDPGRVEILVVDDGPGIPEADRERAFEPFERLGAASEGSGIGLALVRRLVERYGGRVELQSAGERGTLVRLTWPGSAADGAA